MPTFEAILGAGGPLARTLEGFTPRQAQQRMAARVGAALEAREVLLVEAGTGTGKTFAYLVPALLSGGRVLISTGTRTLQDQLFSRDLPLLAGALGRPARIALLKGRSNYLCRARLSGVGAQTEWLDGGGALLARVHAWSAATRAGDMAEIADFSEAHPLRAQITSTRESCTGGDCAEFARCHVFEARRSAQEADIVVVNHHLLLADLALKEDGFGDLLPSVDAVILDEAHQLPDLVAEFFGVRVGSRQLELLLQDLRRLPGAQPAAALIERALKPLAFGAAGARTAWEELPPVVRADCRELRPALQAAAAALDEWGGDVALANRTRALEADLAQILDEAAAGARAFESGARGFTLSLLPYEIAGRFRALTERHATAWVFTSATLTVAEDFSHFAGRLGLESAATLRLDSPFDYERQALLFLPRGLPDPGDPAHTAAVVAAAEPLIEAAGGGAFVLFTSHRALRQAALLLRARLPGDVPLLVQGDAAREQLLRAFRASGRAVLLGTASFWEGVDVPGSALRLVVIDKLPFAAPDDPLVRARVQHLKAQGASPFRDYQLPEAVLALKQGVGRLIRSEADRGVVMICDPRLSARGYGRVFLDSLPPMPVTREREPVLQLLRRCAASA